MTPFSIAGLQLSLASGDNRDRIEHAIADAHGEAHALVVGVPDADREPGAVEAVIEFE